MKNPLSKWDFNAMWLTRRANPVATLRHGVEILTQGRKVAKKVFLKDIFAHVTLSEAKSRTNHCLELSLSGPKTAWAGQGWGDSSLRSE